MAEVIAKGEMDIAANATHAEKCSWNGRMPKPPSAGRPHWRLTATPLTAAGCLAAGLAQWSTKAAASL